MCRSRLYLLWQCDHRPVVWLGAVGDVKVNQKGLVGWRTGDRDTEQLPWVYTQLLSGLCVPALCLFLMLSRSHLSFWLLWIRFSWDSRQQLCSWAPICQYFSGCIFDTPHPPQPLIFAFCFGRSPFHFFLWCLQSLCVVMVLVRWFTLDGACVFFSTVYSLPFFFNGRMKSSTALLTLCPSVVRITAVLSSYQSCVTNGLVTVGVVFVHRSSN